jgi:hypothetical protein
MNTPGRPSIPRPLRRSSNRFTQTASSGGDFVTAFFFSIPLAPKRDERSWRRASALLSDTLASLQQQTDADWRAVIAGHDRPDIAALSDPRITFIEVDWPQAASHTAGVTDSGRKREATLQHIRGAGGGYVMMLDADDLVHRNLVAYVRRDMNPYGYIFDKGYQEHYPTGSMRALPTRGDIPPFHRICGSCAVFHFTPEDIGAPDRTDKSLPDRLGALHVHWEAIAAALDRPLAPVPFHAAIYRFNTGAQLSILRVGQLRSLMKGMHIELNRVPDSAKIRRDFLPSRRKM